MWESPAWAEATSIVNCPITSLSLFRTGRGGGEQRMGQGRGAATTQAAQDDEQDNFHIVCMVWVSHEHRLLGCDSPG